MIDNFFLGASAGFSGAALIAAVMFRLHTGRVHTQLDALHEATDSLVKEAVRSLVKEASNTYREGCEAKLALSKALIRAETAVPLGYVPACGIENLKAGIGPVGVWPRKSHCDDPVPVYLSPFTGVEDDRQTDQTDA